MTLVLPRLGARARFGALVLAILSLPGLASGEGWPLLPSNLPPVEDRHTMVVLPVLDMEGDGAKVATLATRLLVEDLRAYPRFHVVAGEQLAQRVRAQVGYQEKLQWAREFGALGTKDYERIKLSEARDHLTTALEAMDRIHHWVVAPDEVAGLLITLAKVYLEEGEIASALLTFKKLLTVEPGLRLSGDEFPPTFLSVFEQARAAVRSTGAGRDPGQAMAMARSLGADYVVVSHLRPRMKLDSSTVGVVIYDVHRGVPLSAEERVPWRDQGPDPLEPMVSRLVACIPNTRYLSGKTETRPFEPAFFLDTSYTHMAFVSHPLQALFNNFGVAPGVTWTPLPNIAVQARVHLSTSHNDYPYEDMLQPLQLLRLTVGGGIASNGPRLAVYTITGVELALPSRFQWTTEADCKWHTPRPSYCERQIHEHDPGYLFGVHASAGLDWVVASPVFLHVGTGMTWYILPLKGSSLNLPVNGELGLGYRFQ